MRGGPTQIPPSAKSAPPLIQFNVQIFSALSSAQKFVNTTEVPKSICDDVLTVERKKFNLMVLPSYSWTFVFPVLTYWCIYNVRLFLSSRLFLAATWRRQDELWSVCPLLFRFGFKPATLSPHLQSSSSSRHPAAPSWPLAELQFNVWLPGRRKAIIYRFHL